MGGGPRGAAHHGQRTSADRGQVSSRHARLYPQNGAWIVEDQQLTLNSNKSSTNEVFTLHSNSGTSMAIYQKQTWLLIPDIIFSTLDEEDFVNNADEIFDEYGVDVELKMYYFFKKVE